VSLEQYKTQVLLLHSQQSTLDTLSAGFSDQYAVHCATSGTEALNTLGETPIHVIVSAQDLPGMSGLEALREAKKRSPDTIGILLAGTDKQDGLEALVGDQEVFQIVRGAVSPEALIELIESANKRVRLLALSESANDQKANVDEPVAEHIVMETSDTGASIISDGTGRLRALQAQAGDVGVGGREVDVLVLTKDDEFLTTVRDSARGLHEVHHAVTPKQAEDVVSKHKVGVLVTDAAMVGSNVEAVTKRLRRSRPRIVAIVAGRRDDGELLMDLINRGHVYRFLLKPVSPGRARLAVEASVKHHLEAPEDAFKPKNRGAAAPSRPAPSPPAKANKPRPAAAPRKPAPTAAGSSAESRKSITGTNARLNQPVRDGLDDAFEETSSFTQTMTNIASSVSRTFKKASKKDDRSSDNRSDDKNEKVAAEAAQKAQAPATKVREAAKKPQPESRPKDDNAARSKPALAATGARTGTVAAQTSEVREATKPIAPAIPLKPAKSGKSESDRPAPEETEKPAADLTTTVAPVTATEPMLAGEPVIATDSMSAPSRLDSIESDSGGGLSPKIIGAIAAGVVVAVLIGWFAMSGGSDPERVVIEPASSNGEQPALSNNTENSSDDSLQAPTDGLADDNGIGTAVVTESEPLLPSPFETFLASARDARDTGNLYAPPEANAVELYLQALAIDADSTAQSELDSVLADVLGMVESAILVGNPVEARAGLDMVAVADPQNARLNFLSAQIDQLQIRELTAQSRVAIQENRLADAAETIAAAELLAGPDNAEIALVSQELASAESQRQSGALIALAKTRLDAGQLIAPQNDNAQYFYEQVLAREPGNAAAQQGLIAIASKLGLQAREAIDSGQLDDAEALLGTASALDSSSEDLTLAAAALARARASAAAAPTENVASDATSAAADTALDDSAEAVANASPGDAIANTELATTVDDATVDGEPITAPPIARLSAAPGAASNNVAADANESGTEAPGPTGNSTGQPEQVPISQLTRTNYVGPEYPRAARRRNVTGSVDVSFTVTTDGRVRELTVLQSDPPGTFDESAIDAVRQWRFAPVIENGVAVEKRSAVRLGFALQ